MRTYLFVVVYFLGIVQYTQAQVKDTTLALPEVVVTDTLNHLKSGLANQFVPTTQLQKRRYFNLGEALQEEGLLFLRTYGLGSLATANVRGAAASQTTISWNDIPIQSPMLGQLDLSLLPVIQVDELGINYDQAIGGNIFLRIHQPDTGLVLQDGLTVGSFGQLRKTFAIQGGHRLRYKLSTQLDKARNDFPFQLSLNLPEQRQSNAAFRQQVFQQSLFWRLSPQHQFELHLWQQATKREIPPTSVENLSLAYQEDKLYRQQILWQAIGKNAIWHTQLAHLREELFYVNPIILLEAPSDFKSWILQTKRRGVLSENTTTETRIRLQRTTALANGYAGRGEQESLFASQSLAHRFTRTLAVSAVVETQWTQGQKTAYGWRAALGNTRADFGWQLSVHRNFRIPTLNDLLWIPGGNPQLRTETALGQSLSVRKSWNKGSQIRLELFNRTVDNWIQWAQLDGQSLWSAQNVTEVWSRGLQFRSDQAFKWQKVSGVVRTNYQWTRSTYQVAVTNPSIDRGEQLWYTPVHQGFIQLQLKYETIGLMYTHRLVSSSTGINDELDSYDLGDIQLEYQSPNRPGNHVFVRINNFWNTEYRVIERRPMPGQQWSLGYRGTIYP